VQDSETRKYLLTLTVGYDERANINATVHKVKKPTAGGFVKLEMFLM
jgi:hypothetical protein